jgi:hypothetical protein
LAPVGAIAPLRRILAELPQAAEREHLRMQDRNAGSHARHVDAGGAQLRREAREEVLRLDDLASLRHQPADDRMGIPTGPIGRIQRFSPSSLPQMVTFRMTTWNCF